MPAKAKIPSQSLAPIQRLTELVRSLRSENGCPWDREQTIEEVRSYLVEEAHEVAAAIDAQSWQAVEEELGDLLFQIAFICSLANDAGKFDLQDVARGITQKMIARHPHDFGDEVLTSADEVASAWERGKHQDGRSVLAGVPLHLPALVAALRIGQKAGGVGFDWSAPQQVLAKVHEELAELEALLDGISAAESRSSIKQSSPGSAVISGDPGAADTRADGLGNADKRWAGFGSDQDSGPAGIEEEIGDLLQSIASLARHLGVDPERALARSNLKFRRRFRYVEDEMGDALHQQSSDPQRRLQHMEELWQEAKRLEARRAND